MSSKYAVYQLIQGHPALIAANLSHKEAGTMVDNNDCYYMCTMQEWQDLKDYIA